MRKLAAIMFTDIVGYTALMGEDEQQALQLLEKNRTLLKPIIGQYNGEWLKEMGDGSLSSFASAVDAVNCALQIQHILREDPKLSLRIGIHVGDVVFEGGDVFGDGVNVASRIEPLAEPGCVCVSEQVYEAIRNKSGIEARFLGEKKLKGVDKPIKAYAVTEIRAPISEKALATIKPISRRWWTWVGTAAGLAIIAVAIWWFGFGRKYTPERGPRSVAVLPFVNLSDSKEDEYFSDGVTDAILTHLTKIGDLSVIARTSVMQYKNTEKRAQAIARELEVASVLEGSISRAGNRVRIIGQLIDAHTDEHLWADIYDRDLTDIFAIQSDVARNVAVALKAILSPEVDERIKQKPTTSLVAYDYYLRALDYYNRSVEEKVVEIAIDLLNKAVKEDSTFIEAYALLVELHLQQWVFGHASLEEREPLARQSLDMIETLDPNHPAAHYARSYYYRQAQQDNTRSLEEAAKAVSLRPGNVLYIAALGNVQMALGRFEEGLVSLDRSLELDPLSSTGFHMTGRFYLGSNLDRAIEYFDRAIELAPDVAGPYINRAWAEYYKTGETGGARRILLDASELVDPQAFVVTLIRLNVEDGLYEEALDLLDDVGEENLRMSYATKDALTGWILSLQDSSIEARVYFTKARVVLEDWVHESPSDAYLHSDLALVFAHLGMNEEAIREGSKALELMPISYQMYWARAILYDMAEVHIILGENDQAIDYLYAIAELPIGFNKFYIQHLSRWDPLRDHPRFQALLADFGEQ
ncbi:adenylate/guanylate cyclase domain-containing protein [Candidatus Neomarinimicrobiota bacterium]